MAYPQEKFTSIKSEVIEVVSELLDSFTPLDDEEAQLQAHIRAIGHYINRVARIGMAANVVGYRGLHDICVVFQGYLRELHAAGRILSDAEKDLLEEWPILVMSYLSSPLDETLAEALIDHLQRIAWSSVCLTEAESLELREVLHSSIPQDKSPETNIVLEEPHKAFTTDEELPALSRDELLKEQVASVRDDLAGLDVADEKTGPAEGELAGTEKKVAFAQDDFKIVEGKIEGVEEKSILDVIKHEVSDSVEELLEEIEIAAKEGDIEAIRFALDLCADRLEIMSMSVAESGMMGLMDVSLIFLEGLRNLATQAELTDDKLETVIFQTWSDLVAAYLDTPNDAVQSEVLIEFLRQLPWITEISDEEADVLQSMLVPELIEISSADDPDTNVCLSEANSDFTADYPQSMDIYSESSITDGSTTTQPQQNVAAEQVNNEDFSQQPATPLIGNEFSSMEEIPQDDSGFSHVTGKTDIDNTIAKLPGLSEANVTDSEDTLILDAADTPSAAKAYTEFDLSEMTELTGLSSTGQCSPVESKETFIDNVLGDCASVAEASAAAGLRDPAIVLDETTLELLKLVSMEIASSRDNLQELLSCACVLGTDEERMQQLQEYAELLGRFVLACESVGFSAMQTVLQKIQDNLLESIELSEFTQVNAELLSKWPELVLGYFETLGEPAAVSALIAYLSDEKWKVPLLQDDAQTLRENLLTPCIEFEEEPIEPRQRTATDDDISLTLPEDVNPALLESLLHELPQHTSEFTEAITRLTEGAGKQTDVDIAQRVAHTLKGSANTVGVPGIASLTHHIEDILLAFSKHEVLPGSGLAESLMKAADTLEVMSESLLGMGPPPADSRDVLQEILDWANRIDAEGIPEDDKDNATVTTEIADKTSSQEAHVGSAHTHDEKNPEALLRVSSGLIDDLLRVVGETVILNGQLQERLKRAFIHTQTAQQQNVLFQQLTFELEQLVDIQGLTSPQQRGQHNDAFDALEMDQYNELHTVTHRLVEAATDSQEISHDVEEQLNELDSLIVEQGRLHRDTQETVLRTRMVPVNNIVPRLHRGVRQTARLTDKKVQLDVSGSETLMDSDVLNDLIDPLMHILRNAIDHGIEPENERLSRGKDKQGQISLTFLREGDHMIVRCRDDGAGLDYVAIRRKAVEYKIITAEQAVTEDELRRIIIRQGFSTRKAATQTSGRGIGMDAVYNRIISMKGSLKIESESGKGTLIELRLPVTFISIHALLVRQRNQLFALSSRGVEQIIYSGEGTLHEEQDMLTYQLGEEIYDAVYLNILLQLGADRRRDERNRLSGDSILLVREDTGTIRAVIVDEVIASQDLVVKQMGRYVPEIEGIEGATILGDGSVAPVLDIPQLLHSNNMDTYGYTAFQPVEELEAEAGLPCALVVDDSLTARRTLAEFVADVGYEVRTARDGLEAIEVMAGKIPDILLVDLEMPRMNGLELSSHVRAEPRLSHIPIIMITSRSTEKHRQQAEAVGVNKYLTKPFSEEELIRHIETQLATV